MVNLNVIYPILAIPALFVPILIAALFAEANSRQRPLGRAAYASLVALILAAGITAALLGPLIVGIAAGAIATGLIAYLSVSRLVSMGRRASMPAVCTGIPVIGIGFMVYLALAAPAPTTRTPNTPPHPAPGDTNIP